MKKPRRLKNGVWLVLKLVSLLVVEIGVPTAKESGKRRLAVEFGFNDPEAVVDLLKGGVDDSSQLLSLLIGVSLEFFALRLQVLLCRDGLERVLQVFFGPAGAFERKPTVLS